MRQFMAGVAAVVAVILLVSLVSWASAPAPSSSPSSSPDRTARPSALPSARSVVARGHVVPLRVAELTFPITGTVDEVLVEKHQRVEAGDLLIRLDQREQRAALGEARAEFQRANAARERATAQLALLGPNAPDPERRAAEAEVALAQAEVVVAAAAVERAERALDMTELVAPFAGRIGEIEIVPGEIASPTRRIVTLGDDSAWRIEARGLDELDVVRIAENDPATITLDLRPDLELVGTVDQIQISGVGDDGSVSYVIVVRPSRHEATLEWNMSALVVVRPRS